MVGGMAGHCLQKQNTVETTALEVIWLTLVSGFSSTKLVLNDSREPNGRATGVVQKAASRV